MTVAAARRQLTLLVPTVDALALERVRERVDPVQHRLIPAHVTLCREDELARFADHALHDRLLRVDAAPLTLTFGAAVTFDGHGVLLPCAGGEAAFHALRATVLGDSAPRRHAPHVTLAHPRNERSPHNVPDTYATLPSALSITFTEMCVIEQRGHEVWRVLERYALGAAASGVVSPIIL